VGAPITLQARLTDPVKPLVGVTKMVEVPLELAGTATRELEATSEKLESGLAIEVPLFRVIAAPL